MGVNVTAYPTVTFLPDCPVRRDPEWCDEHSTVYALARFARTAEDWPGWDSEPRNGVILGCCYDPTSDGLQIMDASYSGYGHWRRTLSQAVLNVQPEEVWEHINLFWERPFVDLVNWADNEGCIGRVSAARLAEAFADEEAHARYEAHVRATVGAFYEDQYLNTWTLWADGLRQVADGGGLVRFG